MRMTCENGRMPPHGRRMYAITRYTNTAQLHLHRYIFNHDFGTGIVIEFDTKYFCDRERKCMGRARYFEVVSSDGVDVLVRRGALEWIRQPVRRPRIAAFGLGPPWPTEHAELDIWVASDAGCFSAELYFLIPHFSNR